MSFITFDSFISIPVLICFYYSGALFLPIIMLLKREWISKTLHIFTSTFPVSKWKIVLAFILMLFLGELFWRMMFEMLIGYFQMRDFLHHLSH